MSRGPWSARVLAACLWLSACGGESAYTPERDWVTAESLTFERSPSTPQLAMNARGEAILVWIEPEDPEESINTSVVRARRFTPEGGWGQPERIDAAVADWLYRPRLAINRAGDALAVWQEVDGGGATIASYTEGAGWSSPRSIADEAFAYHGEVSLADDGTGLVVLSARTRDEETGDARSLIVATEVGRDATVGQSSVVAESGVTLRCASTSIDDSVPEPSLCTSYPQVHDPYVSMNAAGEAVVTWLQLDDQEAANLVGRRRVPGRDWLESVILDGGVLTGIFSFDGWQPAAPRVVISDSGRAVAAADSGGLSVFEPAGGWSSSRLSDSDDGVDLQRRVVLAVSSTGLAMAAWGEFIGDGYPRDVRLVTSRLGRDGAWATPRTIGDLEVDSMEVAPTPGFDVAINDDGAAVVVWREQLGRGPAGPDEVGVRARRYLPSSGWQEPVQLNTSAGEWAVDPTVALDEEGRAIAVWEQVPAGAHFLRRDSSLWWSRLE